MQNKLMFPNRSRDDYITIDVMQRNGSRQFITKSCATRVILSTNGIQPQNEILEPKCYELLANS